METKTTQCPHCSKDIEYFTKKNWINCSNCQSRIIVEPCEDAVDEEPKLTKTERLLALRDELDALMAEDD